MKVVKRLLSLWVVVFAVLIGWSGGAVKEAKAESYNGYSYSVGDDGGVIITGYSGDETKLEIPGEIDGKSVTRIGDFAFFDCSSLTSISIPKGVASIGDGAFCGCSSLTSISIPERVTSIGRWAFENCSSLTSISIPKGVTSIGEGMFSDCSSLTNISIPERVTSIGEGAFAACSNLTDISIPKGVTSISNRAFIGCSSLTNITVDSNNKTYDSRDNCNAIIHTETNTLIAGCSSTNIPESVTSIGDSAFENCSSLTSISIPEGVTSIGNEAFSYCSGLTGITFPESMTSIGYGAFYNCSALASVTIPGDMTSVEGYTFYAFSGCSDDLVIWTIKNSHAFQYIGGCVKYLDEPIGEINGYSYSIGGDGGVIILGYSGDETKLVIPEEIDGKRVTRIGSHAFEDCSSLTSISIPEGVTNIGSWVFYNCSGLTSISIPKSLKRIGDAAFSSCSGLTSISIPEGVTSISERVFIDCSSLTSITVDGNNRIYDSRDNCNAVIHTGTNTLIAGCSSTKIPASVTSIGDEAFAICSGLTSINIPEGVTRIGSFAFDGCRNLMSINIPKSVINIEAGFSGSSCSDDLVIWTTKDSYADEYAMKWGITVKYLDEPIDEINGYSYSVGEDEGVIITGYSGGETELVIPGEIDGKKVTSIGAFAFSEHSSLTSVTIPEGVTSIRAHAFEKCSNLAHINIPESATSIGNGAFSYCSSLTGISIPEGMTSISDSVFIGCSSLTNITVDGNNKTYDSRDNCNAIIHTETNTLIAGCSSTNIPESVTSMGEKAFFGCSGLTSFTIPESVTSIGKKAFSNCSDLASITIPERTISIGDDAFSACSKDLVIWTVKDSCAGSYAEGRGITVKYLDEPIGEINGYSYSIGDDGGVIILGYSGDETELVIPGEIDGKRVTRIGSRAFCECSSLTSISIPEGVTGIDRQAFAVCRGLTSISIPNSVTRIGSIAFGECEGLTSISIPESVTSIGEAAFANCSSLTSVSIPESVTRIGREVFYNCSSLTSITVDGNNKTYDSRGNCNAIIYTGTNTLLAGCSSTKIPESVTSIGEGAFKQCRSLMRIIIPESVTNIESDAFSGCSDDLVIWTTQNSYADEYARRHKITVKYFDDPSETPDGYSYSVGEDGGVIITRYSGGETELVIPEEIHGKRVISIGDEAFAGCGNLTSISIPEGVTSIGDEAFWECSGLTSIIIPEGVISIGNQAFAKCDNLTSISIPEGVTSIGDRAFKGCSSLTNITVDGNNKIYDSRENCNAIIHTGTNTLLTGCSSTKIPESVTSIGDSAFFSYSGLTSISIPKGVTSIGDHAFFGCRNLTSITIPESVTNIDFKVFGYCPDDLVIWTTKNSYADEYAKKEGITVKYLDETTGEINGYSYFMNDDGGVIVTGYSGDETELVIPGEIDGKRVTSIGDRTFSHCSGLTSITIPESVTSIGDYAFYGCSGLTGISIPEGVTSIGDRAFYGCSGLTGISIPDSVTSIGDNAFYGCSSLTSISIPESVTSIGRQAFTGCSDLTSINIPEGVTKIGDRAFIDCDSLTHITVDGNNKTYDSRENCNAIIHTRTNTLIAGCSSTKIPEGVTSIGDRAFYGCSGLTSISIPEGVTSIGGLAFWNCSGLTSISIPEGVTSIGNLAFWECSGLTSITIPGSVTEIGSGAFTDCSDDLVICTTENSYADQYAKRCGITVKYLEEPTDTPEPSPTPNVTASPEPATVPSDKPSTAPSEKPGSVPSSAPSETPGSVTPTSSPTGSPEPNVTASPVPSTIPSDKPGLSPSETPGSVTPTDSPAGSPAPGIIPTQEPGSVPTQMPDTVPSPSTSPNFTPSAGTGATATLGVPQLQPQSQLQQQDVKVTPSPEQLSASSLAIKSGVKATAGKKKLTLMWKKVSGVSGYQIQVSRKKNFKGAKKLSIKKSKKGYTIKGLKSGKFYYVRVRTYVEKGGKKVYGKWVVTKKKVS